MSLITDQLPRVLLVGFPLEEALVITPELDGVTPSLGWDASVLCRGILKSALGDSQVCPALWKVD